MSRRTLAVLVAALVVAGLAGWLLLRRARTGAPPAPPAPVAASAPAIAPEEPLHLGGSLRGADLPLAEIQNRFVTMGQLMGPKGLVVLVTNPSCPQDAAWEDRLVAVGNESIGLGFGVIGIVPDGGTGTPLTEQLGAVRARAQVKGYTFPMAVDEGRRVVHALGATRTPETYLFTAQGRLAYHGAIDDDASDGRHATAHYLREAMAALTRDENVPIAETLPVGCVLE
jgi:hypothetical protein